jgi:hypothetical protein
MAKNYPDWFLSLVKSINNKRAKTVIDHIMKYGSITTDEIKTKYGYDHPPRAARDVRELGIPLETETIRTDDGRNIARYKFGDLSAIRNEKLAGRKVIPKWVKSKLVETTGSKCNVCLVSYEERYLQVDHRVPYEVSGDPPTGEHKLEDYMLICSSCNRAKSWSCEHCENWLDKKDASICMNCFWGNPESYTHMAMRDIRRLDLVYVEEEVKEYDKLKKHADAAHESMPDYVKKVLRKSLKNGR